MILNKGWIACICLLIGTGCGRSKAGQLQGNGIPQALSPSTRTAGLALYAYALDDTLSVGDSLIIVTLLRNYGAPIHIRNDPDFYHFVVRAPNGDTLSPVIERNPDWDLGQAPDLVLARGAILGQITNLSCEQQPFAPNSKDAKCMQRLELTHPGMYKLVARYSTIKVNGFGAPPARGIELESDTILVVKK